METIKLSKKTFWFKYWSFIKFTPDEENYKQNTCDFRRDLIFFTALFFLTLPYTLILLALRNVKRFDLKSLIDKDSYVLSVMLTFLSIIGGLSFKELPFIIGYLYTIPLILGFLTAIILAFSLIFRLYASIERNAAKRKAKRTQLNLPDPIVTTLWRNLKDKVCSKIEYVD